VGNLWAVGAPLRTPAPWGAHSLDFRVFAVGPRKWKILCTPLVGSEKTWKPVWSSCLLASYQERRGNCNENFSLASLNCCSCTRYLTDFWDIRPILAVRTRRPCLSIGLRVTIIAASGENASYLVHVWFYTVQPPLTICTTVTLP